MVARLSSPVFHHIYSPALSGIEQAEIAAIIEGAPLACIVGQTSEGLVANHIPLLSPPNGTLMGHVAPANDMHRLIGEGQKVLAIFRSDDAYVLPEFYPTKLEHHRHVPTWSYHAVHVHGSIRFQHDTHAKRLAVGLLMRIDEQRVHGKAAWRMADATADYMEQMLGAIVAFWIEVHRRLAKSKLSQNREERDYLGAIAGLLSTGQEPLAEWMEHRFS